MADPIIFLDFDGVLNHRDTLHRVGNFCEDAVDGLMGIDPFCVQALDSVLAKTKAKVVISSTWRTMFPVGQLAQLLRRQGLTMWRSIVGKTPTNGLARGYQIQAWIDAQFVKPSTFVILDDGDDMVHLLHRLVRCNPYDGGLTSEVAGRAISMLGGGSQVLRG